MKAKRLLHASCAQVLEQNGLFASPQEAALYEDILGRLDVMVKSWVKSITRLRGYSEAAVAEANAKIYTFGSFRLGVHGQGACVGRLKATQRARHAQRRYPPSC